MLAFATGAPATKGYAMKIKMLTTYASPYYGGHPADSVWEDCPDKIAAELIEGGYALLHEEVVPSAASVLEQAEAALAAARTSVELATAAVAATSPSESELDAPVDPPQGEKSRKGDEEDSDDPDVETATADPEAEDSDEKPIARQRRPSRTT